LLIVIQLDTTETILSAPYVFLSHTSAVRT
jgi:hypothetical protein